MFERKLRKIAFYFFTQFCFKRNNIVKKTPNLYAKTNSTEEKKNTIRFDVLNDFSIWFDFAISEFM